MGLSIDTPIRTVTGWRLLEDVEEGDLLYNHRGRPVRVTSVSEITVPRKLWRMRFTNGQVLFADAAQRWQMIDRNGYLAWKARREREGIEEFYPADWADRMAEVRPTEQIYRDVLRGGGKPDHTMLTEWMQQSEFLGVVPIATPFEGITDESLPEDAHAVGADLRAMSRDYLTVDLTVIPRVVLNAPPDYRREVLRGLLGLESGAPISKMDFMETYRDATLIDDVVELIIGLGYASYLEPKRDVFVDGTRVIGVTKPLGLPQRDGKHPTIYHRGPMFEAHLLLTEMQERTPVPVKSLTVEGPLFLAGRGLVATGSA